MFQESGIHKTNIRWFSYLSQTHLVPDSFTYNNGWDESLCKNQKIPRTAANIRERNAFPFLHINSIAIKVEYTVCANNLIWIKIKTQSSRMCLWRHIKNPWQIDATPSSGISALSKRHVIFSCIKIIRSIWGARRTCRMCGSPKTVKLNGSRWCQPKRMNDNETQVPLVSVRPSVTLIWAARIFQPFIRRSIMLVMACVGLNEHLRIYSIPLKSYPPPCPFGFIHLTMNWTRSTNTEFAASDQVVVKISEIRQRIFARIISSWWRKRRWYFNADVLNINWTWF